MDPFDQFSGINLYGNQGNPVNPYNSNPLLIPPPGQQAPGAGPRIPPFTPDEEESILSKIGGGALKGLGYVGSSLGKAFGGRAIRGLLGGHADELASIIPFSDAMGITDPTREVRGSDLLGGDKDTPFLSPEGIGGLGLDILLDPATYLTFGGSALTEAGQAAKRAGTLADTATARMLAGQQGLVGLGLPFSHPSTVIGAGQGGADFLNAVSQGVAKIPGATGLYNNVLAPAGRYLGALFDPTVNEATSTEGRIAGRQMTANRAAADAASRQVAIDAAKAMGAQGTDEGYKALRNFMELGGEAPPEIQSAAGIIKPELERMRLRLQELGLPGYGNELDDIIGYMPRYKTPLAKETGGFGKRQMLPTQDSRLAGREDILKDFVQGTNEGVNKLTSDKALYDQLQTAPNLLGGADEIRRAHLGWDAGTQDEMYALRNAVNAGEISTRTHPSIDDLLEPGKDFISTPTPEGLRLAQLERQYQQSVRLADMVKNLDPKLIERGGMFLNNPLEDFAQHSAAVNRVIAGGEATMDMLAKNAGQYGQVAGGKSVPLMDVLDRVFGEGGKATANSKLQMIQRLGLKAPEDLLNMQVPASVAADAGKFLKAYTSPEGVEQALRIYDSMTNLTKAGQTSLWPAFHARNAITGIWQNYVTNAFDPRYGALNPMRYIQPFIDAWKVRSPGAVIEGIADAPVFKGLKLTDAEATQKVMEMASAHGLLDRGNIFSEVIGGVGEPGVAKTMRLPGEGAIGLKEKLKSATWNPLDIAGVGGVAGLGKSNVTQFAPGVVGQHFGEAVDQTNRLSAFIAKIRQGFEPGAASAEAKLAHFDYGALTPFERSVMRRVIPFYNWMSNNIPFTIRQLAEQPGGKVGLALKASGEAQGRTGGFLPDQVASGLALPLMEDKEAGTKTFLSHTGLPFEDIADYASGTDYLRNLNPLIKAPVELATGHQFESGRRLADLYQFPTGSTVVNELLANSPVGRAFSTFRTAIDERKNVGERALNMLTGLHDTTVDMPKAEAIAARNYIEDALSGNPHFRSSVDLQPRADALADLSPQEVALLRLRATLDAQARQQASQARRIGVPARPF